MAYDNSTVVEQTNRNPKIECSNLTTSLWREKLLKHCDSWLTIIAQWLNSLIIILIFRVEILPLEREIDKKVLSFIANDNSTVVELFIMLRFRFQMPPFVIIAFQL